MMKNNLFLLALATLLLVSCNKDKGNHLEDDDNVVQITASIDGTADGGTVSAGRATVDNDGEGTFDPGDTWGLYAYTTEGDYMNANTEYKYEETILYWKDLSETEAVTFSAHYPRITEEIADPAAYIYKPWNHTDDLLHATATASKGETVALTFKHLMHRLVVNLIAGDGMEGVDLSSALINSAARDGMPTMLLGVEVNLLTGAVSYNSTTDGINLSNGFNGNADWIVAPQDLTAGEEWLKITVSKDGNEDVWYYHVPADLNPAEPGNQTRLESGKQLTLNLKLKKNSGTGDTEVELTGSNISGWDTQPEITDEVVIGGGASGDIDMTNMTADEVKAAITAALATGHTEIKLTGELSKIGMGSGQVGAFAYNTQITKCDLSGVTDWGTPATLPGNVFTSCTALQEVKLPDNVQVIGEYAFFNCTALTTVNLSQVAQIDQYAFQLCTSLAELTLDKVAAIDKCAFFGCTSLKTLKLPKCTRFGDYIVTGCSSLTQIEATAAGNFVDIENGTSIEHSAVFQNRAGTHTGANTFDPAKCDLVLNADKQEGGTAVPTVYNSNEWTEEKGSGYLMQWKSITFP
mgnify:CR=1 FL=1